MENEPKMPVMPPCRVGYQAFGGELMFSSQEELDRWLAEPLWKRVLGLTQYDKRLRS